MEMCFSVCEANVNSALQMTLNEKKMNFSEMTMNFWTVSQGYNNDSSNSNSQVVDIRIFWKNTYIYDFTVSFQKQLLVNIMHEAEFRFYESLVLA